MRESADAWYIRTPKKSPAAPPAKHVAIQPFARRWTSRRLVRVWLQFHAVLDFDPDTQQRPGADLDATTSTPRRPLRRRRRPAPRLVHVLAALLHRHAQPRAFKTVATFGWTLDEKGRASPSPSATSSIPSRSWTSSAATSFASGSPPSTSAKTSSQHPLLRRLAEEIYRKLRNTFRFLLAACARPIQPPARRTTSIRRQTASRFLRCNLSTSTSSPAVRS